MFAKKKSLETILSSFTKVVQDLRDLREANAGQMLVIDARIDELQTTHKALSAEAQKAACVEEKLNLLLS